jgi:hypothetical protein
MKTTYLFSALLVTLFPSSPCIAEDATGSDVRAVLDGKYALTSEGYAKYQKCVSSISLGSAIQKYTDAIESCKDKAKDTAYSLSAEPGQEDMSAQSPQQSPELQMQQDRAWQNKKLKRSK